MSEAEKAAEKCMGAGSTIPERREWREKKERNNMQLSLMWPRTRDLTHNSDFNCTKQQDSKEIQFSAEFSCCVFNCFLWTLHRSGSIYGKCVRTAGTVLQQQHICLRQAAPDTDPFPMVELLESHWYLDPIHLLRTPDPSIWMSTWRLLLQRSQRQLISPCPTPMSWSFPQNMLLSQGAPHQVMASTSILCFKP